MIDKSNINNSVKQYLLLKLDYLDWLLALVLLLPPFIFLDSASRYFNVKIAALELLFIAAFFIRHHSALPRINRSFVFLAIAFTSWVSITIYFSEQKTYAFNRNLCVIMHILFGYSVWCYIQLRQNRQMYISYLIVLSFLLPALSTFIYDLTIEASSAPLFHDLPFYSNIRHLGYHAAAAIIFSAFIFLACRNRLLKLTLGLWVLASILILMWSGSRASILALVLSALTLILFSPKLRNPTWVAAVSCVITLIFLIFVFKVEVAGYGIVKRTLAATNLNAFLGGRVELWLHSMQGIDSLFWGIGGDNFILLPAAGQLAQAHNVIVQAILDWGLIGAFLFLAMLSLVIIGAIKKAISLNNKANVQLPAIFLLIAYSFLSMVDGIFYHGVPFMLFSVSAALAFSKHDSLSATNS